MFSRDSTRKPDANIIWNTSKWTGNSQHQRPITPKAKKTHKRAWDCQQNWLRFLISISIKSGKPD